MILSAAWPGRRPSFLSDPHSDSFDGRCGDATRQMMAGRRPLYVETVSKRSSNGHLAS
jgi:hypothetical protein